MKGGFIFVVFLLLIGTVSAVDCNSEFNDVTNARSDVIGAAQIFEFSAERMFDEADMFYDELGDHENSDTLVDTEYEMESFLDSFEECEDDMLELENKLEDYNDDIARARSDLPVGCFEQYTKFDDDHDDVNRDFRDIKKEWDSFDDYVDNIRIMSENPETNNVAEAESKMRQIINDIDDFLPDIRDLVETNVTLSDFEFYTEIECIQMTEVTLNKEKAKWVAENNKECPAVNNTPTDCPDVTLDCSDEVIDVRTDLLVCKGDLKEVESKLEGTSQTTRNCDISDSQVKNLRDANEKLRLENTDLLKSHALMNGSLQQYQNQTCETSCGPWFWVAIGLFVLLVVGWLFAM